MPDSKDYQHAMEKVTAGQRWKDSTLEKMRGAQRPRRTISFGRRAIPLAAAAAICLLVIPAAARSLAPVSGGSTAQDATLPQMAAARQMPESNAAAAPFALEAAPAAGTEGRIQDRATAAAYTLVQADSPEEALPADTQPAEDADGLDAALELLDETLAAEGEGRSRAEVLAEGLAPDGSFAFVLADGGENGVYRLYLLAPAG